MKEMLTLHEKLARMQAEKWLKETTIPITLEEIEAAAEREKLEEVSISLDELKERVQRIIDDGEQFFARFGLTPEGQEELFKMPIMQQRLDEVIDGVSREREELERDIGCPRKGWDLLPFEKWAETEKMLKNLPQRTKGESVQEICVDGVFDRSAQEQIAAIQERLAAALVDVKKAAEEQKTATERPLMTPLWKREAALEAPPPALILPDWQEKRPIDADLKHHYAEQLKIVVSTENAPQRASIEPRFFDPQGGEPGDYNGEAPAHLSTDEAAGEGDTCAGGGVRAVEAIREDIEKMTAKRSGCPERAREEAVSQGEWLLAPAVVEEVPKIFRRSSAPRPLHGVIVSALKAKMHHGNGENPEAVAADVDSDGPQRGLLMDCFAGVTLPGLPLSGEVPQKVRERKGGENVPHSLEAHRRQVGPRRFHL